MLNCSVNGGDDDDDDDSVDEVTSHGVLPIA